MNSNDWKSIGSKVLEAAPVIGGILGGPVGAIVGTVGGMVANALGVSPTPAAVAQELASNPEAFIKLKELEYSELANFRQASFDQNRLVVMDRMNARKIHGAHWMTIVLPIGLLALVAWITHYLMGNAIPGDSKDMVYNIVSQLLTMTVGAVAYWIGTTRSSSIKTTLLGGGN